MSEIHVAFTIGTLSIAVITIGLFAFTMYLDRRKLSKVLGAIPDLNAEESRLAADIESHAQKIEELRESYSDKFETYERIKKQIAVYDEQLSYAELGIYEPHFEYRTSAAFKQAIQIIRGKQKDMVSAKEAVTCDTDWYVDNSLSKGRTMINRQIRLTLRAFNNECEAAIANARWNNVNAMERRILNAQTQIDKMNASQKVAISPEFVELKLRELYLTHELRETEKRERDERAEVSRLAREEQRLIKDAAKAEKEEEQYRKLLDKARSEIRNDQNTAELEARISQLESDLEAAHAITERAKSMAQMTRSGYVYIISNVGSFGEELVKIGMTRRLNPDDRVRELGDASVPFKFDTHAIIYSEDAPALENALHAEFDSHRVNAANYRKEFFRVDIEAVEEAVSRLAPAASFFLDREAQEYYETLALRRDEANRLAAQANSNFPPTI